MLDTMLLTIHTWMTGAFSLALIGCFLWGMVSILLSPCHMASIPLMVGYVAGQGKIVEGREAVGYASLFSLGLFISITVVGMLCALLGRMLGDVPVYIIIPIGALLFWLGLDLMGVSACRLPSASLSRIQMRGPLGALLLGLSYGILSGACTFGFIAPILAIITMQQRVAEGIILICIFALGHCLPIVAAGSSVALSQRFLAAKGMQHVTVWGRRMAGLLVMGIGGYFVVSPFLW